MIARNSTFAYKGKSIKVQEVARELGAQYVVEGSVQKTEQDEITMKIMSGMGRHLRKIA